MNEIPISAIPVLDNCYVKFWSASPNDNELNVIKNRFYKGMNSYVLADISQVTIEICLPISFLEFFGRFTVIYDASASRDTFFKPEIDVIRSGSLQTDIEISESINSTLIHTNANQHAYAADNCDRFIASLTTPIATYRTVVMIAPLSRWMDMCFAPHLPKIMIPLQSTIKDLLTNEFKQNWDELKTRRPK